MAGGLMALLGWVKESGGPVRAALRGGTLPDQKLNQFQKSVLSFRPIEAALKAGSLPAARWSV